jgi:S1-C subfamily serine protease
VLVSTVLKDSPAEKAGVKPGDLLLSVGGRDLEARFPEDMPVVHNVLARLPIGDEVAIQIGRGGETHDLLITPDDRKPAMVPQEELRAWGVTMRDMSMWTELNMARQESGGVQVTSVRAGGPSAKAKPPLQGGDIILSVEGEKINSVEDLRDFTRRTVNASEEGRLVPVLVEFDRRSERTVTVVEIGIEELEDPSRELQRSWLPMETQVLTRETARQMGIPNQKGVRVTRLYNDRAEDFPFEVGDILIAMDGDPIEAAEPHDVELFRTLLRQYRVGLDIDFDILRDGEKMRVNAKTVPSPPRTREMDRHRDLDFGFVLRELTYFDLEDERLVGVDAAVMVDSVEDGTWASLAGLRSGDVLIQLAGEEVTTLDDARKILEGIHETMPDLVSAKVRRGVQFVFIEFEPVWEERNGK